jgi:hypothetical protein
VNEARQALRRSLVTAIDSWEAEFDAYAAFA